MDDAAERELDRAWVPPHPSGGWPEVRITLSPDRRGVTWAVVERKWQGRHPRSTLVVRGRSTVEDFGSLAEAFEAALTSAWMSTAAMAVPGR